MAAAPSIFRRLFDVVHHQYLDKGDTNLKADRFCIGGGIALTKSLTANAVGAARSLFKDGGIPREVVVHNVTAMAMKIYSFLSDLSAY
jgi:hypothetical protein